MQLRRRALAVAVTLVLASIGPSSSSAIAMGGAEVPVGHPICSLDGEATGWSWYAGRSYLGRTSQRFLVSDGVVYPASPDDCADAVDCLSRHAESAGRVAAIVGTPSADELIGTPGDDLIVGLGGDDVVDGRNGDDIVCGGAGDDRLDGGKGGDRLYGGEGEDIIAGNGGDDVIVGDGDIDSLRGGAGADVLRGGPGNDGLYGGSGDDRARGGPGDDACFGQRGDDRARSCRVHRQGGIAYGAGPGVGFEVAIDDGVDVPVEIMSVWVDRVLGDARSWIAGGDVGLRRLASGGSMTILLARPETVDRICAPLDTGGYYSCRNGRWVAINVDRWLTATSWWPAGLEVYRHYVINHEVGHFLGHGHVSCPGSGAIAPVMMQQTKGLDGCVANGWPYP